MGLAAHSQPQRESWSSCFPPSELQPPDRPIFQRHVRWGDVLGPTCCQGWHLTAMHMALWGSHPKGSVSLASSRVFSEAMCWYGFVKTVYPSEGNFAFGIESDGKCWPQPSCTASCVCLLFLSLPLRPSVVNKPPFGLGPMVSPLLSPGGRKSTSRPSPVCCFCSPKPDFYSGCFIGHQWMHFIASLGDLILLLCH